MLWKGKFLCSLETKAGEAEETVEDDIDARHIHDEEIASTAGMKELDSALQVVCGQLHPLFLYWLSYLKLHLKYRCFLSGFLP